MFRLLVSSASSGLLILLNTGIVDHANAQKTGHVYVETKLEIDDKLLPVIIDCTDQTYDIKGDGLAWVSIYHKRKSRQIILEEYINLCGTKYSLVQSKYDVIVQEEKLEEERRIRRERQREYENMEYWRRQREYEDRLSGRKRDIFGNPIFGNTKPFVTNPNPIFTPPLNLNLNNLVLPKPTPVIPNFDKPKTWEERLNPPWLPKEDIRDVNRRLFENQRQLEPGGKVFCQIHGC